MPGRPYRSDVQQQRRSRFAGAKRGSSTRKADLFGALAHELRNPLASLRGCAITLGERYRELDPPTREGLVGVIVRQSERMDWLVNAVCELGRREPERLPVAAELSELVAEAASHLGVAVTGDGALVGVDRRRLVLALEALVLSAVDEPGRARLCLDGRGFELRGRAGDAGHGARRWKLDLARRLLREEGCTLRLRRDGADVRARVTCPAPEACEEVS